jgi:hypothetical protein
LRLRRPAFEISEVPTLASRQTAGPTVAPILNAFAIPNGPSTSSGFAEFASTFANSAGHDIFGVRVDHNWTNNFRWSARFNQADSEATYRGSRGLALNSLKTLNTSTTSLTGDATYMPSANMVISGRLNYSRNKVGQGITLDNFGGAIVDPALVGAGGFVKYDLSAQSAVLISGESIYTKIDQIEPSVKLSWITGAHSFVFGGEYRRVSFQTGAQPFERNVLFTAIGDGIASRILELSRAPSGDRNAANTSVFVQDDWRIKTNLSLNLGVRWETSFAPDFPNTPSPVAGTSTRMSNRLGDLAPRAGISYDLFGKGRWVFRAGAGLYFDQSNRSMSASFADSYPFVEGRYAQNVPYTTAALNDFRPWIVFADRSKTPRTWQTYAEFTQKLPGNVFVMTAYQGMFGRDLLVTRAVSNTTGDAFIARSMDNSGRSNYHAGVLTVYKRLSNGFSINGRYTFAKSIDNFSAEPDSTVFFYGGNERGRSDFDVRHDVSINGQYRLPNLFQSGWRRAVTRDWTILAFFNARTGFPLNVNLIRSNGFWDEIVRPDLAANIPLYRLVDGRSVINPAAFTVPTVGQGNLGRNALRGAAFRQVDLGLSKVVRLGGDSSLLLKIEAINLLNTTNFADMEAELGTVHADGSFRPSYFFGQSLGTFGGKGFLPFYLYGGARNVQLSAKFTF